MIPPRVRQRETRWLHLERRLRERYGQQLTRKFLRAVEAEVVAGRIVRDEYGASVLTVVVEGEFYRVAWDYERRRLSTFYPLEVNGG